MTVSTLMIWIAVILFIAILVIFPKARVLIKGFINVFIEDRTKTPEGARAVYQEAIDQATNEYTKANNILQKLTGKLDTAEKDYKALNIKISDCEKKCEAFASKNCWQEVELFSAQREELLIELEPLAEMIEELKVNVSEAEMINKEKENKLKQLKKEKETIVAELVKNRQLKEIYDDMDELKSTNTTSKLLQSVKEGAKESRETAVGARAVHNNKTSTKIKQADAKAAKIQSNEYVENLKKKYSK